MLILVSWCRARYVRRAVLSILRPTLSFRGRIAIWRGVDLMLVTVLSRIILMRSLPWRFCLMWLCGVALSWMIRDGGFGTCRWLTLTTWLVCRLFRYALVGVLIGCFEVTL